jgi:3-hydroxyacyl-[acyl-carrier-protein] dehydratase
MYTRKMLHVLFFLAYGRLGSSEKDVKQHSLADLLLAANPAVSSKPLQTQARYSKRLPAIVRPRSVLMDEEAEAEADFKDAAAWSAQIAEPEAIFDINKVKEILPHRYPFLLVDKVIEFVPGKKAVAIKKVTANEEFFNGHFPSRPIMPGVLQLEAMAQVGGIVALQEPVTDGKGDFFFAGVNKVKWRRPVVPGDTLVMEMELTAFKPKFGLVKMKGKSYIDGQLVVEGEFQFAMVK